MKQIIRFNAVETPNQRSDIEKQISKLYLRQRSIGQDNTFAPLAQTNLIWEDILNFLPKVILWEQTAKIASVCDPQTQQITNWIKNKQGKIKAKAQIILRVLVERVYIWTILLNRYRQTPPAVNMTKIKFWLNNIWKQKQQTIGLRYSLFSNFHVNY
ncbi:MAG: hypothetical protein F6K62_18410 [Sphaerospermopsis sp. SIO1G2]|nr:hypothetical protein [Sphaerospermopsis sp. SIO1G1]NET72826.1 hypothetical protein [Sphaerospermopsis sp. SIO1G2]